METSIASMRSDNSYHSKEVVSNACSEIFENILKKTYDEENPFRNECETLVPAKSAEDIVSAGSSDFVVLPKRILPPELIESRMQIDTDTFRASKTKYTASFGITQVHYLNQKVGNPFEKLLIANESFTYHKPYYNQHSENTIMEEDEAAYEYEQIEGMSISAENIRQRHVETNSCAVQKNASSGILNDLMGNFEQEITISNDSLRRNQLDEGTLLGQGDNNIVNDSERPLLEGDRTCISIKINFAFYAKLLAFLLTINTLMFFKTFVFSNILNFYIR